MKGERIREEDYVACNHEHDRTARIQLVADFPEYLQKESISATCL